MAEKNPSNKKLNRATKALYDYETVILAHKFTCPYYSSLGLVTITDQEDSDKGHCGAESVWTQANGKECKGECWYMKHFIRLIKKLKQELSTT